MPTEELYGSYHFLLEIQGVINDNKVIVGGFKTVSGMDSETEIIEFKQGNDLIVRKKPGRTTYSNIVLERGYTATDDLWQCKWNAPEMDADASSMAIEKIEISIEKVERA
jgi:phage tail-like protein